MVKKKNKNTNGNQGHAPQIKKDKALAIKPTEVKCYLCNHVRPVFATDEQIKRLPDRSLTPFL